MALSTVFTETFGVRHPIALAPMGGSAGGALAAAVSRGAGSGSWAARTGIQSGWHVRCRSSRAPKGRGVSDS
jgi:nitronate monooxygenase